MGFNKGVRSHHLYVCLHGILETNANMLWSQSDRMLSTPDQTWSSGGEHRAESELRHWDEGQALTKPSSLGLVSASLEQNQGIHVFAWKISYRYFLRLKAVESLVSLFLSTVWTEITWTAHFFWDKTVSDSFLTKLIMNRHLISALGALCPFLLLLHPPTAK